MSVKCFICDPAKVASVERTHFLEGGAAVHPKRVLQIAADGLTVLKPNMIRFNGLETPCRKGKVKTYDTFGVSKALTNLGDIDLSVSSVSLCAVGTRNSILELFQKAEVNLQITVGLPPGVFIGVSRQENWFKNDSIAIKITSGAADCNNPFSKSKFGKERIKHGNNYVKYSSSGPKLWDWNWFDVTEKLGVATNGTTTLHPQAFELPLKNIFDNNKWW